MNNVPPIIVLSHTLSFILGYLVGSIPTAFLVVRWKSNVDIRSAGSGNVGALNSFQVTRSKLLGGLVLMLDLIKGIVVLMMASVLFGDHFSINATGGVAAVVGHNFPVWLKFKGGRGLATAAGVMLMIAWPLVVIWNVFWLLGFLLTKHVNAGNTIASAAELIGILVAPASILGMLVGASTPTLEFRIFGLALFSVILTKHIEPAREFLGNSRITGSNAKEG